MKTAMRIAGLAVLALLCVAANAFATDFVGDGEPPFTKGTSNTWWYTWNRDGTTNYEICFTRFINGQSQGLDGDGCAAPLGQTQSGVISKGHTGLASGTTYTECAGARENDLGIGWTSIPGDVDACTLTTMDTSRPAAATSVDGTADYTNNPNMTLTIQYGDSISYPWPGGSTFDCWRKNANTTSTGCQNAAGQADVFQFDSGCSSPVSNTQRNSSWQCTYNISSLPGFGDGKWYYCVLEADYAVPDNPSGSNQFVATSDQANLSPDTPGNCGYIVLDRQAPTVNATANKASASTGDLISFSVSAGDSVSGVSGAYDWDFGDNTQHGSGAAPTHTYTQPGTYNVAVTTHDGAGNAGVGHVTITISGPPIGQPPTTTTPTTPTTTSPTPTPTPSPAPSQGSAPETTITQQPKSRLVAKHKKVKVRFAFTADQAGASFECKLDHEAYDPCTSPLTRKVTKGKHTFSVRATSATGKTGDAAVYAFKVKVKRHHHHHH